MIDDSELFHASSNYDPVKAREYYLRTRKLKGRNPGATKSKEEFEKHATGNEGKYDRPPPKPKRSEADIRKARREKMLQEKAALERRLEKLKSALELLVNAAKARSGVKVDPKGSKSTDSKSKESKADKKDKPETASQKKERAKKAKEAYEKENPGSLSGDLDILREQIADMQEKIREAVAAARSRDKKAEPKPKQGANRAEW